MSRHLPEDPSQFMQDMTTPNPPPPNPPPPNPPPGREISVPQPDIPLEVPVPAPDVAEPPSTPDVPLPPGSPFANLDDDEQNSFDEDEVLDMDHMTRE